MEQPNCDGKTLVIATTRKEDHIAKRKIAVPVLKSADKNGAKLLWRRLLRFKKMTY